MLISLNCSVLWREISEVEGEQSKNISLMHDKETEKERLKKQV